MARLLPGGFEFEFLPTSGAAANEDEDAFAHHGGGGNAVHRQILADLDLRRPAQSAAAIAGVGSLRQRHFARCSEEQNALPENGHALADFVATKGTPLANHTDDREEAINPAGGRRRRCAGRRCVHESGALVPGGVEFLEIVLVLVLLLVLDHCVSPARSVWGKAGCGMRNAECCVQCSVFSVQCSMAYVPSGSPASKSSAETNLRTDVRFSKFLS